LLLHYILLSFCLQVGEELNHLVYELENIPSQAPANLCTNFALKPLHISAARCTAGW
jgi:hypothetical protein